MKKVFMLMTAAAGMFGACSKEGDDKPEEDTHNYVHVNIVVKEDVLESPADDFFFKAKKPISYHLYFIDNYEVIADEAVGNNGDRILIPEREYDFIVISSTKLSYHVLQQKDEKFVLDNLSDSDSSSPILIGFLRNEQIEQNRTLEISVQNPYAAVIVLNAEDVKEDHGIFARISTLTGTHLYHRTFLKNNDSKNILDKWAAVFTIKTANHVLFANEELESNKLYIYTVDDATGEYKKEIRELIFAN